MLYTKYTYFLRAALAAVCLAARVGYAEVREIILGGDQDWRLSSSCENVASQPEKDGRRRIVLSSANTLSEAAALKNKTEMLLTFDSFPYEDKCGNYTPIASALTPAAPRNVWRGEGTALCMSSDGGLTVSGGGDTFFGEEGRKGSVAIAFWLYPKLAENGEQIFFWRSYRFAEGELISQYMRADIFQNRVQWTFDNIFVNQNGAPARIELLSRSFISPETWGYHLVAFDEESGLLEYYINGRLEDARYATENGRESGSACAIVLGSAAPLEICPRFSGMIDEFSISASASEPHSFERYPLAGGRYVSRPLDSGAYGSSLRGVSAVEIKPPETDTAFFVRGGDNFYSWTDEFPEWVPAANSGDLAKIQGRYFQVAADLYCDGAGSVSPVLKEIRVQYDYASPPRPPTKVFAEPGNGCVTLSWSDSAGEDARGYLVYYGERRGEYLGTVASNGSSPIDAGSSLSLKIDGLTNGKIYYFAVAAYGSEGYQIPGILSEETYARPLRSSL